MWLGLSSPCEPHWLGVRRRWPSLLCRLRRHPSLNPLCASCGGLKVLLHLGGALGRPIAKLLLELVHVNLLGHVGARGALGSMAGSEVSRGCLHELALLLCVVISFASPMLWPSWPYRLTVVVLALALVLAAGCKTPLVFPCVPLSTILQIREARKASLMCTKYSYFARMPASVAVRAAVGFLM